MTAWSGGAPSSPVWHHEALEEMSREEKHITGCKYAAARPDGCMLRDHRASGDSGDLCSPAKYHGALPYAVKSGRTSLCTLHLLWSHQRPREPTERYDQHCLR
ncbi:hypothetical protein CVIRNUC_007729 [Coccomyxa viridis]|uniref:Uncharacterized protein n=1 Tax=Coccomyxa viridis TaxID=1274662 RepID=A0AAV1IDI7_9CHLO|nr:hypothetical protein CVIRNUC_007729 [Coccomyxa viridis]